MKNKNTAGENCGIFDGIKLFMRMFWDYYTRQSNFEIIL